MFANVRTSCSAAGSAWTLGCCSYRECSTNCSIVHCQVFTGCLPVACALAAVLRLLDRGYGPAQQCMQDQSSKTTACPTTRSSEGFGFYGFSVSDTLSMPKLGTCFSGFGSCNCSVCARSGLDLSCGANLPLIGMGCRRRSRDDGSNSKCGCKLVKFGGQNVWGNGMRC
jgi:hypothetical protein